MKKYIATAILILSVCFAKAQSNPDTTKKEAEVFSRVEVSAQFPGGLEAFGKFLVKTVRYPADARFKNIQGKVFLTFVVERDGSLTNMKVVKGVSDDLDAEAIRVMKLSPKWEPGKQGGVAVRQNYTVPISFALAKD